MDNWRLIREQDFISVFVLCNSSSCFADFAVVVVACFAKLPNFVNRTDLYYCCFCFLFVCLFLFLFFGSLRIDLFMQKAGKTKAKPKYELISY